MTKSREAVLEAVRHSNSPMSAADVAKAIGNQADLATVYRALHWLSKEALIDEFAFACEERGIERYYIDHATPHSHFFHCETCHRFFPVSGCGAEALVSRLEEEEGFLVENHILYFTGCCRECRLKRSSGPIAHGE